MLASHLGRPKGKRKPELSLRPVAPRLAELLGAGVSFCDDCIGPDAARAVAELAPGQVLLLENLRFHAGEEKNDPDFAKALAELADCYVNDAFGTAHRAHASTAGITRYVADGRGGRPAARASSSTCASCASRSARCVVLLGGAKVSDKLAVLEALAPHADVLADRRRDGVHVPGRARRAGGRLARRARPDRGRAPRASRAARASGRRLLLPSDHVVAERDRAATPRRAW